MKAAPLPEAGGSPHAETRIQLLEAAGEVFAEVGFRAATVREICRRAKANVAAVNYHFGDKETLYLELLRYTQAKSYETHPLLPGVGPNTPPEKKLRAYVHSFLMRIFDKGRAAWHGRLMSREMYEPTAAMDSLVEEKFRPHAEVLWQIIADIMNCPVTDERVRLCASSVLSQCVFYHHCRPIMLRLDPKMIPMDTAGVERIADHITQFSLAAMKHLPTAKS